MNVSLAPEKYVLAVSGGVDSMVLLDMLRRRPDVELVVAHFDHGIRTDSDQDRKLVEKTAHLYGLPFVGKQGNLGTDASEDAARHARYDFLRHVQKQHSAKAIITAHHQDDLLETAIFNLMRGTGRKGLSSLQSHDDILRPLLHINKDKILAYARAHHVAWREDSTNQNEAYARNYIRAQVVPRLGTAGKKTLLKYIEKATHSNVEIDALLETFVTPRGKTLDRKWFTSLPHNIAREVMADWLRHNNVRGFNRPTIERLVVAGKIALPSKVIDINKRLVLRVEKATLKITERPLS